MSYEFKLEGPINIDETIDRYIRVRLEHELMLALFMPLCVLGESEGSDDEEDLD